MKIFAEIKRMEVIRKDLVDRASWSHRVSMVIGD
jgi:hypothetical protein